ncbi:MAG: DNA cytosine methyltransferase [Trueperaceae bacterium]
MDLFSGAGGFGLGVHWAIEAIGCRPRSLLAADVDSKALDVHAFNLRPKRSFKGSVRDLLRVEPLLDPGQRNLLEPGQLLMGGWPRSLVSADVLIGGPPCQGHSNLNNRTRRADDRNELYLWMAAAAFVAGPKVVIVENVPTVKADAGDVVARTMELLTELGYRIGFDGVLNAEHFGVSQSRKRHFLIAVREDVAESERVKAAAAWLLTHHGSRQSVLEAIGDLTDVEIDNDYDAPSVLSTENQARVEWLIREDEYNLPDKYRPACHRDKPHTYESVYGRMDGDLPAPTLSTGFLSPGRGRYVHPQRPRTLTPHEGARVQGFPDDFRFVGGSGVIPRRTQIARMIGDAVPPPLAFHVAVAALCMLEATALQNG